eukprot:Nitzschia sp. Nitz4//scaffold151_size53849//22976//23640//NITZ4_006721-RA/size53849-processed-gene-0.70-mRNA-1//-1//CDS//3329537138//2265//frame0
MAPLSPILALGAGCYWGTEKFIVKDFQRKFPGSIKNAMVGFMNPDKNAMPNPSYQQVCSGLTGHVEVLNVELDNPTPERFEELVKFFFSFHDPTTPNRQGNDAGTQYASAIFYSDDQQYAIAKKVKDELQTAIADKKIKTFATPTVTTALLPYTTFYAAHEEHQAYLEKNPRGYCNHRYRFKDWPEL